MPTTKEIIDGYFSSRPESIQQKIKPQVDRPEVYEYEKKLGKSIFEMDVDELFGMIASFNSRKSYGGDNSFSISYTSYNQIASSFRNIWEYYIDTVGPIKNPWNKQEMRGRNAYDRIAAEKKPITKATLDNAIKRLHTEYRQDSYIPDYVECILLLFYNGFAEVKEIVELKEEDINFQWRTANVNGRTIRLSDRCLELLQKVHNLDVVEGLRGYYYAVSYRGSYFKFIIRQREIGGFDKKTPTDVGATLIRRILANVRNNLGIDLNYRSVYLLGFYDYIVGRAGEARAKEILLSYRNSADVDELMKYAKEYGFNSDRAPYIKMNLRPFV